MIRRQILILAVVGGGLLAGCSNKSQPQHETEKPHSEAAALTPENAKAAGIETAVAGPAEIRETLMLYGSIKPNAELRQEVRARYPGVVRAVAKRPGDAVAKGERLLTIESNDSLEPYPIRSPIAGTVLERRVNPGEAVDGSQTLLVVADLSTVWAEFAVFARDLERVRAGQTVLLRGVEGQAAGQARIVYVAPVGSGDTQSVVARAEVGNRDRRWIPGQFLTGEVVVADVQVPVAVVPAALQTLDGHPVVFVPAGPGFEPRPVAPGRRDAEAVEITQGLAASERYVATHSYLVKAELTKRAEEND